MLEFIDRIRYQPMRCLIYGNVHLECYGLTTFTVHLPGSFLCTTES